ncbi:MAG: type II secretion system GspH family protein [Planctomycetaceae bacterium]|nr:type II secretion system GspH family protein [Planctomycetaceae bacterium]
MRISRANGFTLMELVVTILISSVMVAAVAMIMVDSHRGWLDSYAKIYGGAADDAAMSGAAFERILRKASHSRYVLNGTDDITVYYYSDWQTSEALDAFGRFYRSQDDPQELYLETGTLDPQQVDSTVKLAAHVTDLQFRPFDGGVEMVLLLDDGREQTTLVTAAILHNE